MDYDKKWSRYRIRLTKADVKKHEEFLTNFLKRAYNNADSYGLEP